MYDYLIVGTGLFGSVFAYEMSKRDKKCIVIDKRNHIGGNIYTENIDNIDVHRYGAHIFHTNNRLIWNYINQFGEFNNFINSPIAIYKEKTYNLPFNMNTFAKIWNVTTPEQARMKIEREIEKANINNPMNLEEQAISLVGKTIYNRLIKGYTEKQWGKKCSELPPEIIKRIPIRFTYDNNYFNDKFQGIPQKGYTKIIENMLNRDNIEVRLNTDYCKEKLLFDNLAKKIVFTGPIDEFFDYCFGTLEYRSLRFKDFTSVGNYQGNAVINYTDKKVPYTRTIEHRHFNDRGGLITIVTEEYPQKWIPGREPFYPINDKKNNELYEKYKDLANSKQDKVVFGGRLGLYKYLDMDDTIKSALELVDKEIELW